MMLLLNREDRPSLHLLQRLDCIRFLPCRLGVEGLAAAVSTRLTPSEISVKVLLRPSCGAGAGTGRVPCAGDGGQAEGDSEYPFSLRPGGGGKVDGKDAGVRQALNAVRWA